ncbi:MAG: hypothetical protein KIS85_02095 [Anaerolineales bacterium]|nr:hypothetical protein [Anaerolineales bacterium]
MTKPEKQTRLDKDGRIAVPAKLRKAAKKAQQLVRKYNPEGRSLTEELIQARRKEAQSE